SCVVFNRDGPLKTAYRKFNIETREPESAQKADPSAGSRSDAGAVAAATGAGTGAGESLPPITAGDDYAAIHQAVKRRFARAKSGEAPQPDVLFIDGGLGQLNAALEALDEVGIENLCVVAIAKGPTR